MTQKENHLTTLNNLQSKTYEIAPVQTIDQIIESKERTLQSLQKFEGTEKVLQGMVVLLTDLVKFFNVGKSMDAKQVISTAQMIVGKYPAYKISDIKLCFNNAKQGMYGQIYDRIDGQVIMLWLQKYDEERNERFDEYKRKQSHNYKEEWRFNNASDDYIKALNVVIERIEQRKRQFVENTKEKISYHSTEKDLYNEYYQQFNDQFKNNGFVQNQINYIEVNDEWIDRETYIKMMFKKHTDKLQSLSERFNEIYQTNGVAENNTMYILLNDKKFSYEEFVNQNYDNEL